MSDLPKVRIDQLPAKAVAARTDEIVAIDNSSSPPTAKQSPIGATIDEAIRTPPVFTTAQKNAWRAAIGAVAATVFKGDYADRTAYSLGDIVLYDSHSWLCVAPVADTNTTRPSASNTSWLLLSSIGDAADLIDASISGKTITFTRRSGGTETVVIPGLADDEVTPEKLDAGTSQKKQAFRERLAIPAIPDKMPEAEAEAGTATTQRTIDAATLKSAIDEHGAVGQVPSDWDASTGVARILNKPDFATVATSGSYADLSDRPSIPIDTDLWRGTWVANASPQYEVGQIVRRLTKIYLCLEANSDATFTASKWEQLDIGSPNDLVNAAKTGNTLRFTRRDGTTFDIDLPTPGGGGLSSVSSDATLTGDGTSGDPLKVANPAAAESTEAAAKAGSGDGSDRMSARRTKQAVEAQTPRSVQVALSLSTDPPTADGGEIVMYAGAPSDQTDVGQNIDLSTVTHIRLSEAGAAPGSNLSSPGTDDDAISLLPFFDRAISSKSGVLLTLSAVSAGGNPQLSEDAVVYAATVTRVAATNTYPAYIQLAGLTWGAAPRTPDNGAVSVDCDFRLQAPTVAGKVSGLPAIPAKMPTAEAEAGTATTQRTIDAATLKSAIDEHGEDGITDAQAKELEASFEALFDETLSRTFGNTIAGTGTHGEALYTEPTGVSQDRELVIDYVDSDGSSREDWLKSIGVGDWIYVTKGANSLLFKVEAASNDDTNEVRKFLFTVANALVSGSWPSDASLAGAATFHFANRDLTDHLLRDLSNLKAVSAAGKTRLRTDLPTGTAQTDGTLTAAMKLLLGNFDTTTIEDFVLWHDIHHTGVVEVTGLTFTTGGVSNQASDKGKLAWPGTGDNRLLTTNPLNDTVKATLLAAVLEGREVVVRVSDAQYKTGKARSVISESNGLLTVALDGVTETGGAIANDASISMDVHTNVVARDELTSASIRDDLGSLSHQYLRTTGGLTPDVVVESPITDLATVSGSEKKMANAGAVKSYIDDGDANRRETVVATGSEVTHASNVYTVTPGTALGAYEEGVQVIFEAPAANTGAVDINVSGLGAKDVVDQNGAQLTGGEIPNGHYAHVLYDGIFFVLLNAYDPNKTPGWRGVRRELTGELSGASGTGWYNVLTCQVSVPANARCRVRGIVYGNRAAGSANLYFVRIRKVAGGNTTGIHGTGDYNPLELRPMILSYSGGASTWNDWTIVCTPFDFEFDGPSAAGTVKINLAINAADQSGSQVILANENVYINRGESAGTQQLPGSEGPWRSWMELAYFDEESGAEHGVTTTTVSTRDSA